MVDVDLVEFVRFFSIEVFVLGTKEITQKRFNFFGIENKKCRFWCLLVSTPAMVMCLVDIYLLYLFRGAINVSVFPN